MDHLAREGLFSVSNMYVLYSSSAFMIFSCDLSSFSTGSCKFCSVFRICSAFCVLFYVQKQTRLCTIMSQLLSFVVIL